MDSVATYIEQNRDMAMTIRNTLNEQRKYLNHYIDHDVITKIRKITDVKYLQTLTKRCSEIIETNEDKQNGHDSAKNLIIINQHVNLKSNIENELFKTLHQIRMLPLYGSHNAKCMFYSISFRLNNIKCVFNITLHDNSDNYIVTKSEIDYNRMGDKLNETCAIHAFQSMMTLHEYETFLNKIIQTIVIYRRAFYVDNYTPHYPPTVNVAKLLLCAINEQEQGDNTLAYPKMSLVERVLYDEFLLKCITEKL